MLKDILYIISMPVAITLFGLDIIVYWISVFLNKIFLVYMDTLEEVCND